MSAEGLTLLIGGLIASVVAGILTLRKGRVEIDKTVRNGVIEEWRGANTLLREESEKCHKRASVRIDAMESEISALRTQVTQLFAENSELRKLLAVKDTRVETQATNIEKLQTAVTLLNPPPTVPSEIAKDTREIKEILTDTKGTVDVTKDKVDEIAEKVVGPKNNQPPKAKT